MRKIKTVSIISLFTLSALHVGIANADDYYTENEKLCIEYGEMKVRGKNSKAYKIYKQLKQQNEISPDECYMLAEVGAEKYRAKQAKNRVIMQMGEIIGSHL
uniref:Uncharacterized protein n=1 Tax=Aliivibrio fischeri TaxID=668 RepID=H2ERQ7_ALIFS|nr:hypothetical protein [Aliivibrio fischeri]AEY78074.1 hypothetical protein [Aliivibrio fischeri]